MRKLWMGCTVAVISCTLAAWAPQPTGASRHLLAKAQSEFAEKAREAFYERGIVRHVSPHDLAIPMGRLAESSYSLHSPVERPQSVQVVAEAEVPFKQAPAFDGTVTTPPVLPTGSDKVAVVPVTAVARDAIVAPVDANTSEPSDFISPHQTARSNPEALRLTHRAATLPEGPIAQPDPARTKVVPHVHRQPAGRKTRRHSNPHTLAVRRGMNVLRARAPEIAAIVARYM
jgi:hypothetical protein